LAEFGANHAAVSSLIKRASRLRVDEAMALFEARVAWFELRTDAAAEHEALASAERVAKRAGRLGATRAARKAAADAFRQARRGEIGPWLSVAHAVSNAAGALVLADLLDQRDYQLLYGPWRQALGDDQLVAMGPGPVHSAAQRRHVISR